MGSAKGKKQKNFGSEKIVIVYKNVTKMYNDVTVVDHLNLTIEDGEFLVFIGSSGCGKTTSLKMLNRLIEMNEGDIYIDGKNTKEENVVELRRRIGYVIQQIGLFPNMTVEENISVVPKLLQWSKERCRNRVQELLELVGMPYEENARKYPNELSGGQQQRVGVLRALAAEPPIVLMDEPFGALDPITRDILQDEIKTLQQKLKISVAFVTHDMDEAVKLADKICFMNKGKVLQFAAPEEMLKNPAHPMISDFMGKLSYSVSGNDLSCADVMKKNVFTLKANKKILESIELMKHKELDSAIVVDSQDKFKGIVTIENIKQNGKPGEEIGSIIDSKVPSVSITTSAKESFDILTETKANYIVVLNRNATVAGIITKTSMTKALASVVWGGDLP